MELTPELVAGLVTAIIGVLTALSGWLGKRDHRKQEELRKLSSDYADLREQLLLMDQWMYGMSRALGQNGIDIPDPPDGLRTTYGVKRRDG